MGMAVLGLSLMGCNIPTATPTPTLPPTAILASPTAIEVAPTPSSEDLPRTFALILAEDENIIYYQAHLFIYSQVVNSEDLWFGVSQKKDDLRQCWLYQEKTLSKCSQADIKRAFYIQKGTPPIPKIFFAIASMDEQEALIIVDVKHYRSLLDPIDGFRYVLQRNHGQWQVKSWTQVY